jgi:UDPglucose--hexose-1-phosphate uridylyltransferase
VWPTRHRPHFDRTADDEVDDLGDLLLNVLGRIDRVFDRPDFNLIVKTGPFTPDGALYHWRIEILPRTTSTAGWEWGTGLLINTMFPERAAELLRAAG